ncbi:hypothetical protein LTR12_018628, partial [Friedmanniomyces endolithicus]
MRSYKPDQLFTEEGKLIPELRELPPKGNKRMSANPITNGGTIRKPLKLEDFRKWAIKVTKPGTLMAPSMNTFG